MGMWDYTDMSMSTTFSSNVHKKQQSRLLHPRTEINRKLYVWVRPSLPAIYKFQVERSITHLGRTWAITTINQMVWWKNDLINPLYPQVSTALWCFARIVGFTSSYYEIDVNYRRLYSIIHYNVLVLFLNYNGDSQTLYCFISLYPPTRLPVGR